MPVNKTATRIVMNLKMVWGPARPRESERTQRAKKGRGNERQRETLFNRECESPCKQDS